MGRSKVHEIRRGLVLVEVRERSLRGAASYSLSAVRLYRDGPVWRRSLRFSEADVPRLRLALDEAHRWMLEHTLGDRRTTT